MKKSILFILPFLFLSSSLNISFAGIFGATDNVPAATLLVPFFEVGIASSHDTLLVVNDVSFNASNTIHYQVWDIDGNPTSINGNASLGAGQTWSASMAGLIKGASDAAKTQLTDGDFYRGFVTIDSTSGSTTALPTDKSYPFSYSNSLDGYIYYVRIPEGSSNGLNMVHIEYVGATNVDPQLQDFYKNEDGMEQIDATARFCAEYIIGGGKTCQKLEYIYEIHSRVFLDPTASGTSRIIVFAWDPDRVAGPSDYCNTSGLCSTTYFYDRYDEAGNEKEGSSVSLNHVVNVIDVQGEENGWVIISNVPSNVGSANFQIYAFSFNSATTESMSTNWDAIFESLIAPIGF